MQYISYYSSPLGKILLSADDKGLCGLWLEGQKYYACSLEKNAIEQETSVIKLAKQWLDEYFRSVEPTVVVPLHLIGTEFQLEVWGILRQIPYGKTITYKEIAEKIAQKRGLKRMSSQAVGGAVGHNPVAIIVPCHRVIGSDNSLTGYAGGIERKLKLLEIEKIKI